jgi:hypothetical protein
MLLCMKYDQINNSVTIQMYPVLNTLIYIEIHVWIIFFKPIGMYMSREVCSSTQY